MTDESGEIGVWRLAEPEWMPLPAQQANFATAWGFYFIFVHYELYEWAAWLVVGTLNVIWQVVMGYVPASKVPYFGGDGFSYTNLVYAASGMTLALIVDVAMPPHWRPLYSNSV